MLSRLFPIFHHLTAKLACNSDEFRAPNRYEAMSMALNNMYVNAKDVNDTTAIYQSSSKGTDTSGGMIVYYVDKTLLKSVASSSDGSGYKNTRCVKR